MPSSFYHIAFELYPSARLTPTKTQFQGVWVPKAGSDIFHTQHWPSHRVATLAPQKRRSEQTLATYANDPKKGQTQRAPEELDSVNRAISRHLITSNAVQEESRHTQRDVHAEPEQQSQGRPHREESTEPPTHNTTSQDWRFGRVRIVGVDQPSTKAETMERLDVVKDGPRTGGRGEAGRGHGNGTVTTVHATLQGPGTHEGKVTKASFEAISGKQELGTDIKETDVGWGIVHLYRDGDNTARNGGTEIYSSGAQATESNDEGCLKKTSKGDEWTTLCIPAVPSYLTPSDFLSFVGEKTREEVSHFRMVMTGSTNRYLVLMKFRDGGTARKWRAKWDGKVFNSTEPETCHVVFVKSITFQTPLSSPPNTSFPELSSDPFSPSHTSTPTTSTLKPFPPPTPSLVELPTCPVCLERMDDTTGLLTISCQHVFHCSCLQKWRGGGCPVCRHTNPSSTLSSQTSLSPSLSPLHRPISNSSAHSNESLDSELPPFGSNSSNLCTICDSPSDLWICLICGNVGCGRYKGGHAKEHWKSSGHHFALEIETQHVWDYADDVWVHRLIRGKGDGKVVELPSSRHSGLGGVNDGLGHGHRDEDLVPREKIEALGMEYTHLLTSQLESQRVYFEDLINRAMSKASSASSAAATATAKAEEGLAALSNLRILHLKLEEETIPSLEKELQREKRKADKASELARNLNKSLGEERRVGEGLLGRVSFLNKEVESLRVHVNQARLENESLKEENRDLSFAVCGAQKVRELEEGAVAAAAAATAAATAAAENADREEERPGRGMSGSSTIALEKGEVEGGTMVLPERREDRRRKGKAKG